MNQNNDVSARLDERKRITKCLYLSDISEEIIALQLDIDLPVVIDILTEENVYQNKTRNS